MAPPKNDGRKYTSKNVGVPWKKKRKISKLMDAGNNNKNETEGDYQNGMDRQETMEKKNKIKTLDIERCETSILCTQFYYYYYYYYYVYEA